MIRNFFRHLLESIKSLKRNGWMTIASVSAVTITLTLLGVILAVIMNVTKIAEDIENDVDVSVFVEIATSQEDMDKLEAELKALPNAAKVTFSSSKDQYDKLVKNYGDSWKLFDGDDNPLYNVFVVSPKEPSQTKELQQAASKLKNVNRADYGELQSEKIFKIANWLRKWGLIGSILLLVVAVFLISNTIRITIISRKREIQIMRLVGAKNGFIRWPFFLEGAWIGAIGAIVPILLMSFAYTQVFIIANKSLSVLNYSLIAPNTIIMRVNLLMLAIGVVIGSLGSVLSMRRFLKI